MIVPCKSPAVTHGQGQRAKGGDCGCAHNFAEIGLTEHVQDFIMVVAEVAMMVVAEVAMSEQTVSFSIDSGLMNAFAKVAEKNACDNTELLKAFIAEYVQQDEREQQYNDWFKRKVERGMAELRDGKGLSTEQANAQVAAFKASFRRDPDEVAR